MTGAGRTCFQRGEKGDMARHGHVQRDTAPRGGRQDRDMSGHGGGSLLPGNQLEPPSGVGECEAVSRPSEGPLFMDERV